ncbi:SHNi-TPR [Nesidiocoris tenuis]|uniref:SHNi-TPR n=1 Tax=Nesidiocoris tenuis TaxID=355587 RepID=A0ABN7B7R0_9HEMI|nr:SHNi-TPR [Nesidiocoris tenuis]
MPAITEPAVESAKCEKIVEVLKQDSAPSKLDADALKVDVSEESKKETEEPKAEEMSEAKTLPVQEGDKKENTVDDAADLEKEKVSPVPEEKNNVPNQTSVETTADTPSEPKPVEEPAKKVGDTEEVAKVEDSSKPEPAEDKPAEASPVTNGAAENGGAVNGSNKEEPTLVKSDGSKDRMEVDSKPSEASAASSDPASAPMESDSVPAEAVPASTEPTPVSAESGSASAEPGQASSAVPTPEDIAKIEELRQEGMGHLLRKNYFAAADSFGKVLEVQAPLYGELSEKLAETYFLYGTAMLEYGKTECNVLGEEVAKKDAEEDDDEEEEEMEVDGEPAEEAGEAKEADAEPETAKSVNGDDNGDKAAEDAEKTVDGKEEDEESFCVAWEMLELAKTTFTKAKNQKRLADTLMKLGDVGIETGKPEAIAEMLQALEVRKSTFPPHHRIIPETHYTIGCAYAFFQIYDEAADQFTESKKCLQERIESLANSENKEDIDEIEEMKKIIPEIEERIKDMLESKKDASKIKETPAAEGESSSQPTVKPASDDKPVTNISHLIKRKRTVDDVAAERAAKISRAEEVPKSDAAKPEEESAPKIVSPDEPKPTEKTSVVDKAEEVKKVEETDGKPEKMEVAEKSVEKSEETVEKSEEKPVDKSGEKIEVVENSEAKPEVVEKTEEKLKAVEKSDAANADESTATPTEKSTGESAAAANQDVAMDQS